MKKVLCFSYRESRGELNIGEQLALAWAEWKASGLGTWGGGGGAECHLVVALADGTEECNTWEGARVPGQGLWDVTK